MTDHQDETRLIEQYVNQRSPELREALILRYVPLIHFVLGRLGISREYGSDYEDLVSYGLLGLIDAVDRYDPEFGTRFSTYATLRIRGQILDFLRAHDWLSRSARQRARAVQQAMYELYNKLQRTPSEDELMEYMGLERNKVRQAMVDSSRMIISIDSEVFSDGENEGTYHEILKDERQVDPSEQLLEKDLKSRLVKALRQLSEREQMVLSLYYNEGLTMREIGEVLHVSESRVCQIHARAAMSLKAILESDSQTEDANRQNKGSRTQREIGIGKYRNQILKSA